MSNIHSKRHRIRKRHNRDYASVPAKQEPREEQDGCFDFYENLRIAIIRQACVDYRSNARQMREGAAKNADIERFLLSPYGQWLCGGQAEYILEKLRVPDLPEKSRQVRSYLGMGQRDFAKLLGTNASLIQCLESGKIRFKQRNYLVDRIEKYWDEIQRKEYGDNG